MKKNIKDVIEDIIDISLVSANGDEKKTEAIIDEAIDVFDDLIAKVNAKDVEDKKAHFKAIEAELEVRANKLLDKVN